MTLIDELRGYDRGVKDTENRVKEAIEKLEREFDMQHACQIHDKWCYCWDKFKKKDLELKGDCDDV